MRKTRKKPTPTPTKVAIRTLVVIDGTWLTHRAFYAASRFSKEATLPTVNMYLQFLCKYIMQFTPTHLVVCFDGRHSFRYDIYPQYKANRLKNVDIGEVTSGEVPREGPPQTAVNEIIPYVQHTLQALGIPWHQVDKFEADDLLASYSKLEADKITLICYDKDMTMLVDDARKVLMYMPDVGANPAEYLDENGVEYRYGFPPKQRLAYQVLIGDSGDGIPSVYSPAKAKKIMRECKGDLKAYFASRPKEWGEVGQAVLLNRKLVGLRTDVPTLTPEEISTRNLKKNVDVVTFPTGEKLRMPRDMATVVQLANPMRGLFDR